MTLLPKKIKLSFCQPASSPPNPDLPNLPLLHQMCIYLDFLCCPQNVSGASRQNPLFSDCFCAAEPHRFLWSPFRVKQSVANGFFKADLQGEHNLLFPLHPPCTKSKWSSFFWSVAWDVPVCSAHIASWWLPICCWKTPLKGSQSVRENEDQLPITNCHYWKKIM